MAQAIANVKKDRLRYTKNKLSANLALLGIVFDALYFINIYSSDVGNYYYTFQIGLSVVYNLIFLLAAFLGSEGIKNYKKNYGYLLMVIGVLQFVRIIQIPLKAHNATVTISEQTTKVMGDSQFTYVVACLILSGVACIASGIVGIIKANVLENYKKENGLQ